MTLLTVDDLAVTFPGLSPFLRRRVGGMERQRRRRHGGPATCIIGRQLATAEGRIVGPDGKLYAHATTTCLVFEMTPRA